MRKVGEKIQSEPGKFQTRLKFLSEFTHKKYTFSDFKPLINLKKNMPSKTIRQINTKN